MKRRNLVPLLIYLASLAGFFVVGRSLFVYIDGRWGATGIWFAFAFLLLSLLVGLVLQLFIHEGGDRIIMSSTTSAGVSPTGSPHFFACCSI